MLHLATQRKDWDLFRFLLQHHPRLSDDLDHVDRLRQEAVLHMLAADPTLERKEKLRLLYDLIATYGANVELRNGRGKKFTQLLTSPVRNGKSSPPPVCGDFD